MAIVKGYWDFIVRNPGNDEEVEVRVFSGDIDVDSTQTDTEDDKQRESVHLTAEVTAFDGDVTFTARQYFDVFGHNVFHKTEVSIADVQPRHFEVSVDASDPDGGVWVVASPLQVE